MGIATKSQRQILLEQPRLLPRALMGGTVAMIEAGTDFMSQHKEETNADYKRRLTSTTLYNGFKDTVGKQSGKLFTKDIVINEDVPVQIEELTENIDGQGRNLSSFAFDAFSMAMVDGISFIYVDFPQLVNNDDGFATAFDQQQQGARPSAVLINSGDILGMKTENIMGTQQVTEMRIMETALEQDPDDEYVEISVQQVRLMRSGSYELWRKSESNTGTQDNWYLYQEGTTSVPYIPIVPVYTNRIGFMEGYPPLRPLAELNKEHWVSSSEQRNALTFARFAMLVVIGGNKDDGIGTVSPNSVLYVDSPQGDIKNVSTAGQGIEQGFIDLDKIEVRMQHTGMSIRVQSTGSTTATEAQINSSESNSSLMAAASGLENSLNRMLQIFADYMGLPEGGTVQVNKSFGESVATGTAQELLSIRVAGEISSETFLQESVRRGALSDDLDIEQETQRVNDGRINSIDIDM